MSLEALSANKVGLASQLVAAPVRFSVPPPSALARRLAQPGGQPLPMQELTRLIELDAGLTVRILRVANSPFYGLSRQVGSVREAVLFLGEQAVRRLALGAAVSAPMNKLGLQEALVAEVWVHGIQVACLGAELARGEDLASSIFTAGLLQDIGRLELAMRAAQADLADVGESQIAAGSMAVSASLLRHWQFPGALADAVEAVSAPTPPPGLLPQALWLANRLLIEGPQAALAVGLMPALIAQPDEALANSVREVDGLRGLLAA